MNLGNKRSYFDKDSFRKEDLEILPCPYCGIGHLQVQKGQLQHKQVFDKNAVEQMDYEGTMTQREELASGLLGCSQGQCSQPIALLGRVKYLPSYFDEYSTPEFERSYYELYFNPAISIIEVPSSIPEEAKAQIYRAFLHFFHDPWACGNAIRSCIERVMDHFEASDEGVTERKKLHNRISKFGMEYPEVEQFLLAVKWIGNEGSHSGELNQSDLLDGFELLEHIFDELFVKDTRLEDLRKKSDAINLSKKPLSSKKKK